MHKKALAISHNNLVEQFLKKWIEVLGFEEYHRSDIEVHDVAKPLICMDFHHQGMGCSVRCHVFTGNYHDMFIKP